LQLAAFFSSFDRFAIAPMLLTIAASLGASLTEVAATASLYYLFYDLMQPAWGMLSDRLGRVRVMRLTFFGAAFAGILSSPYSSECVEGELSELRLYGVLGSSSTRTESLIPTSMS
jgi:MFS family permease